MKFRLVKGIRLSGGARKLYGIDIGETSGASMDEHRANDGTRRFCPHCGRPVSPNARFCGNCGATLRPVDEGDVPAEDAHPSSDKDETKLLDAEPTAPFDEADGVAPEADDGADASDASPAEAPNGQDAGGDADIDRTVLRPSAAAQSPSVDAATHTAGSVPGESMASDAGGPAPADRSSRGPVIGIVIAAVCAVVAIGLIGWWFFGTERGPAVASVPIVIDAEGYSDECTAIPLQVEGSDAEGNAVSDVAFVDATGGGLDLSAGNYTVAFPASPLTPSGVLYVVPDVTLTVVIAPGDDGGLQVSGNDQEVTFTPSTALEQTDEMIQTAYDWAIKDPGQQSKADELHDKAVQVHQEAVEKDEADRKAAEEAQRKAEEDQRAAEEAQRQAEEEATNQALAPIQGWWGTGAPSPERSRLSEGLMGHDTGGYYFEGDQAYSWGKTTYQNTETNEVVETLTSGPDFIGNVSAEPYSEGRSGYVYSFGGQTYYWFQDDPGHLFASPDQSVGRYTLNHFDSPQL